MKETRKQIEAQVRNKLAKQYNERLELANKGKAEAWKAFYGASTLFPYTTLFRSKRGKRKTQGEDRAV